jgi:FkbM family methyltransferase
VGDISLRIRKLWTGLTNPVARRALKLGVGASIEHAVALRAFDFDTVVDVGANRGQFATFIRMQFPRARIVSFEPLPRPAAVYAALFHNDPLARLERVAIARTRGSVVMRITQADDSSSYLDVADQQRAIFGTQVVEKHEAPCGPLSDFVSPDELGKNNLLKIDTQGSELEVLKGVDALDAFSAVYCEVSFVTLYTGQALAPEIISYLSSRGFDQAGVFNLQSHPDYGRVQADMLFVRRQ